MRSRNLSLPAGQGQYVQLRDEIHKLEEDLNNFKSDVKFVIDTKSEVVSH